MFSLFGKNRLARRARSAATARTTAAQSRRSRLCGWERLEDRSMMATIVVTSIQDNTSVDGFVTLREALIAAETDAAVDGSAAGNGSDIITFAPSLTANGPVAIYLSMIGDGAAGPSAFGITTNVSIIGPMTGGVTLTSNGANLRAFYVSMTGNLTLSTLTLSEFRHLGGGSDYGGGAAGMGGAIFANGGAVTIIASTLRNNTAQGGGRINLGSIREGGGGLGGDSPYYEGGGPNGGSNSGGGFGGGGSGGSGIGGLGYYGGFGGGGGYGGISGLGGFGGGGSAGSSGGFGGGYGGGGGVGLGIGRGGGGAGMGGAIFSNGASISIFNSTFAGNSAIGGAGGKNGQGLGGAIFARNGSVAISNSTISNSTAANGGRGLYILSDTSNGGNNSSPGIGNAIATINNTIIGQADNTVSDFFAATNGEGTPTLTTSGVGNLIRTAVGFNGTIVSMADPLLGALATNGGPTATFGLLAASPAINAGSNANIPNGVTNDQRGAGFARINGNTVDSGAFEAAVAAPAVMSPTVTDVTANSATLGGNVITDSGAMITERGILLAKTSENTNPQLNGNGVTKLTATGTTGVFTVNATSLDPLIGYSYIAFATNSEGTTYSTVSTFTTQPAIGQFPGITVQILYNDIIITGTEQDDIIKVTSDGQGGLIVTSNQLINGQASPQTFPGVNAFFANTLGGHDDLWLASPLTFSSAGIDLGNGNDRLVLGADPNDPLYSNVTHPQFGTVKYLIVSYGLSVTGGEGNDQVIQRSTIVTGGMAIDLGEGNNEYNAYWNFINGLLFTSGAGQDNLYLGYLTLYAYGDFDTGAGNDLFSTYGSRFNDTFDLNSGAGYDTVALDVNIYDEAVAVDTGSEADYLLFSRSVAYKSVALTTGGGADTILIGKYISGLDNFGRAIYSNGGSNIDQLSLYTNEEADSVQITANVMRLFYADLGDAKDAVEIEHNIFSEGLLDGGVLGTRIRNKGNTNLRTKNFSG